MRTRVLLSVVAAWSLTPYAAPAASQQTVPNDQTAATEQTSPTQANPPVLPTLTVCGVQTRPAAQPPAGSPPVVLLIAPCFEAQGNQSVIESQTYLFYIQLKPSRPSEGVWQPWDAQAENTLEDDFRRLWGTKFLDNTVTNSGSGVHTDNAGDSGIVTPDVIEGNKVSQGADDSFGIFVFVPYETVTVRDNEVSGVDIGLGAFGGAGGKAVFKDNDVSTAPISAANPDGIGAVVTTDQLGFAYAIGVAVDLVRYEYKSKLVEGLAKLRQVTSAAEAPTEALQASGGAQ